MVSKSELIQNLRQAGLVVGDRVVVHSSLRSIGPIEGGADTLVDALIEAIGEEGTLAMPSFNYTRPLPEPYFDVCLTPGRTGALTEVFRKRPGTSRSIHPTHSVCATGTGVSEFLADHLGVEALGAGSPLDRIAQAGGYILLAGVTHLANSTIHIGEAYAGVPKFYWTNGPLPIAKVLLDDGRIIEHQIDCSASCSMTFNALEFPLRAERAITDLDIGQARCSLMKASAVIKAVIKMVGAQRDILLCNRPNCRPCILSRAHIAKHGLNKRLSSSLKF